MSTHDSDEEFVTIRLPKRTADLMEVSLEVGTSPTALKGQVTVFSVLGGLLMVGGVCGLLYTFADPGEGITPFVHSVMSVGSACLGLAFFIGAQTYRRAFKAKGLI